MSMCRKTGLVAVLCLGLAACMADDAPQATSGIATRTQPRQATYDCGERGPLVVETMRSAVRLTEPAGEVYELAAAPPTQSSRYDADGMALVLGDREALWMKAGSEPVDCRR